MIVPKSNVGEPGREPSISQRTLIGTIWMLLWRVFTRALGMVSTLVLAHLLAPADFGLMGMAAAFTAGVDSLSQLGLTDALVRHRDEDPELLDTAFTLELGRSLLSGLVLAVLAPFAAVWFSEPRLMAVLLMLALTTALSGLSNIGVVQFRRRMQTREQVMLNLVPRLAQVTVGVVAAILLRSYWALLFSQLAGRIVRNVMTYTRHPYRPRLSVRRWRELAGFSAWSWAASMARLVWDRVDAFLLGPALGSQALGVYLLGGELALMPVTELVEPAVGVLFPAIAAARHRGVNAATRVPEVIAIILIGVLPMAIGISAAANCVVALLLGAQWAHAVPVVSIVALVAMIAPFSYVTATALVASGDVRRDFNVMLVAAGVRCGVIYAASTTGDTRVVAACMVGAVLVEAGMFLQQLSRVGKPDYHAMRGSFLRLVLAGLICGGALWLSGLGWAQALPGPAEAVLRGAALALLGFGSFGVVLVLSWRFAGRPPGAETRALLVVAETLQTRPQARLRAFGARMQRWTEPAAS